MKNIAITFDTNIIDKISHLPELTTYLNEYKNKGDLFILKVVEDELTAHLHKKILTEINSNEFLITDILSSGISLENLNKNTNTKIKKYLLQVFDNNVISYTNLTLEEVYNRAIRKIPPFGASTSDKGFKDTLIWISLLQFDFSIYDEVIFITKDNGFLNAVDILSKEFFEKHNIPIQILKRYEPDKILIEKTTLNDRLGVIIEPTKFKEDIVAEYKKLENFRKEANDLIFNISYIYNPNPYHEYEIYLKTFNIYSKLEIPSIQHFIDNIYNIIKINLLSDSVDAFSLFKPYIKEEDFNSVHDIGIDSILQFYPFLTESLNEIPNYQALLLDFIENTIIENNFDNRPILSGDDLPF